MTNEEYHKKLSASINLNRGRIIKLKKLLLKGGLSEQDELKFRHAVIKLTTNVKAMVREEIAMFGGPYHN